MFFTSEEVSPTPEDKAMRPACRINPSLAEETVMASPAAVDMKDHDSPEDPPQLPPLLLIL